MTAPAASPSLAAVLALVDQYRNDAYSFGYSMGEYDPDNDDGDEGFAYRRGLMEKEKATRAALDAELRRLCEEAERIDWLSRGEGAEDIRATIDAARLTPEPAHHDG